METDLNTSIGEFIEDKQYNAWANIGLKPHEPITLDELCKILDNVDAQAMEAERKRPQGNPTAKSAENAKRREFILSNIPKSSFEDPATYFPLMYFWYELGKITPELQEVFRFTPPIIATMPTGSLSASIHEHNARSVLFFDTGIISLTNLTAITFTKLMKPMTHGESNQTFLTYDKSLLTVTEKTKIDDHPALEMALLIAELLENGVVQREIIEFANEAPNSLSLLYDDCLSAAINFVLGHEIGHISEACKTEAIRSATSANTTHSRWLEEFEADKIGLLTAFSSYLKTLNTKEVDLMYLIGAASKIDFFLWAICSIELLVSYIRTGKYGRMATEHHPSATRRRVELAKYAIQCVEDSLYPNGTGIREKLLFWKNPKNKVEPYERVLKANMNAHALFWSSVMHLVKGVLPTDKQQPHSPLWNSLQPLHGATDDCSRPWLHEDLEALNKNNQT